MLTQVALEPIIMGAAQAFIPMLLTVRSSFMSAAVAPVAPVSVAALAAALDRVLPITMPVDREPMPIKVRGVYTHTVLTVVLYSSVAEPVAPV